jgi:hypothetical protein
MSPENNFVQIHNLLALPFESLKKLARRKDGKKLVTPAIIEYEVH